ncbi:MAG: hypothetical protein J0I08_20780 [Rhizobiales bacterium]|nr:hypothetical protein [Hyphomicrobiales bacterium]
MPFDDNSPLEPIAGYETPPSAKDIASPSIASTAAAAFRQENLIGSALASHSSWSRATGDFDAIDRDYNVFDDVKGYEDHLPAFENVFNRNAAMAVKADIDREKKDRAVLAASGWTGFAMTAGASILDPTFLIPGGALAKTGRAGYAIGRSALSVGAAAGVATAVQEAGLQETQTLRTGGESALNIGGSILLGGLLGAGASTVMNAVQARKAGSVLKAAEAPDFDAATDVLHKELADMAGMPRSIGAAETATDTLDDLSIAGTAASVAAKATAQLNPLLRTIQSPSATVRQIASNLMETPVYLRKNLEGEGSTAAETSMKEYTRGAVVQAMEAQEAAWKDARKAGVVMTRTEFREEVGRAMRRGDKSDIPGVAKAAQAWRSSVIEPLKERAITAGLLPQDVSVQTAESYFTRVWNPLAIQASEGEFRSIVRNWINGAVDREMKRETTFRDRRATNLSREREEIELGILRRDDELRRRAEAGEPAINADEITGMLRRVASGERPKMPERLSDWLMRQSDGIHDETGSIFEILPSAARLVRTSRKGTLNPRGGESLDDLALRAWREGFLGDASTPNARRPSSRDFLDALEGDVRGKHVVRHADVAAAQAAGEFDRILSVLGRVGVDLTGATPLTNLDGLAGMMNRTLADMDRGRVARLNDALGENAQRGRFNFLDEADRTAYIDGIVDDIFAKVTGRGVDGDLPMGFVMAKQGPLRERSFSIPDELVEKFLDHDAEMIGRRYARIMSADIELTERFGSADLKGPIETIRAEYAELRQTIETNATLPAADREKQLAQLNKREKSDIGDIEAVRDMLRGAYRPEIQHTNWAKALKAFGTFNYMRQLGGVLISSLTDAVRPAMVHGLSSYMQDGIAPLVRNMKAVNMSREEAKLAGAISERVLASRMATLAEITDPYARNSPFERFLENASAGFSKMTGLLHWNDFHKSVASTMIQNRILGNAEIAARDGFDALPAAERAYMGFLGIGKGNAERLGALFKDHGETLDGVRVANSQAWGNEPAADFMRRAYRAAINKDVDSIIVTKGVGDVPLFANTPTGRAIIQFKSFALATNQRVLLRGLQEQPTRLIGGVVGMAAIGAFVYAIKQIESGRPISDNPGTFVAEGLDRSGIFAIAFEINNALEKAGAPGLFTGAAALFPKASQKQPASRYATRSVAGGFLGPSFNSANDVVGALSLGLANINRLWGGEGRPLTADDVATVRRLTPYASLPYWRWLIDRMAVPKLKEAVQ